MDKFSLYMYRWATFRVNKWLDVEALVDIGPLRTPSFQRRRLRHWASRGMESALPFQLADDRTVEYEVRRGEVYGWEIGKGRC